LILVKATASRAAQHSGRTRIVEGRVTRSRDALRAARPAAAVFGLTFVAFAALFAEAAARHMASLGTICGGAAAHCGWCYAALAAGLAAAVAFAAALAPRPAGVRIEG
jgi:hypothetical protein